MKRNETKRAILTMLSEGTFSSFEIYSLLQRKGVTVSLAAIRMCVQRCKKWNLVAANSQINGTKELRYSITEKGKNRLQWLENQRMPQQQIYKYSSYIKNV